MVDEYKINLINQLNSTLKKMHDENLNLKTEISKIRQDKLYKKTIKNKVQNPNDSTAINIVMEAIDFAYNFKDSVSDLLKNMENFKTDPRKLLDLIEEFLIQNNKIYSFKNPDSRDNLKEEVKSKILQKIN